MEKKKIKTRNYFLSIAIYFLFSFCLEFIYLNLVTPELNNYLKVLIKGTAEFNENNISLRFYQAPPENLFLELEYINLEAIKSPYLFLNNNLIKKYKSITKEPNRIDYFNLPIDLVNYGNNNLKIRFDGGYPSEISVKLKNFLYGLDADNLAISLRNKKEKLRFFSWGSYLRLPIFILLVLFSNILFSQVLKLIFKKVLFLVNTVILGLIIAFIAILSVFFLRNLAIRISLIYFTKLIFFCFYIVGIFSLYYARNNQMKQRLFSQEIRLPGFYNIIFENKLLSYFFLILFLSFGFILIGLPEISKKIAIFGDIIIAIFFLKLFKQFIYLIGKEAIS